MTMDVKRAFATLRNAAQVLESGAHMTNSRLQTSSEAIYETVFLRFLLIVGGLYCLMLLAILGNYIKSKWN